MLAKGEDALALLVDFGLGLLRSVEEFGNQFDADFIGKALDEQLCKFLLLVEAGSHAEAELRVVFEEGVGPGWPAALGVLGVRSGGQVAAVDGGAASGIGDVEPVAEELGEELDVSRLAAAGTCAGELEERLQELKVLDLGVRELWSDRLQGGRGRSPSFRARTRGAEAWGAMLMAFLLASLLFLTGQTSTQTAQPVQSSGATWRV